MRRVDLYGVPLALRSAILPDAQSQQPTGPQLQAVLRHSSIAGASAPPVPAFGLGKRPHAAVTIAAVPDKAQPHKIFPRPPRTALEVSPAGRMRYFQTGASAALTVSRSVPLSLVGDPLQARARCSPARVPGAVRGVDRVAACGANVTPSGSRGRFAIDCVVSQASPTPASGGFAIASGSHASPSPRVQFMFQVDSRYCLWLACIPNPTLNRIRECLWRACILERSMSFITVARCANLKPCNQLQTRVPFSTCCVL
jgi:hypothetical protein